MATTTSPSVSILEAMDDPNLFGRLFRGRSWDPWRVVLKGLFGLPLTKTERAVVQDHTGRARLPRSIHEAWLIVGRRGGKSRIAALAAVYLACFRDYTRHLAPGERATIMVIAADRRQARVVFRYVVGLLETVPMLGRLVASWTKEGVHLTNRVTIEDFDRAAGMLRGKLLELASVKRGAEPFVDAKSRKLTVGVLLDALDADWAFRRIRAVTQMQSYNKRLRQAFGPVRALELTTEMIQKQVEGWRADGLADSSINNWLGSLGQAFRLAKKRNRLAVVPVFPERLRVHNARQGFFERGDFESVVANLKDPDLQDFVSWLYWTGMRPGGAKSLTWAAFDKETWTLRLHASADKIGQGVALALEGETRTIIERRLQARRLDCPLIFHRHGRPIGNFGHAWAMACRAAGLAKVEERDGRTYYHPLRLIYDLRRTAIRNMVRAGVPERIAMAISGHRTRSVFDRYNIVSEADLREPMRKISAYVASLSTDSKVRPLRKAVEEPRG